MKRLQEAKAALTVQRARSDPSVLQHVSEARHQWAEQRRRVEEERGRLQGSQAELCFQAANVRRAQSRFLCVKPSVRLESSRSLNQTQIDTPPQRSPVTSPTKTRQQQQPSDASTATYALALRAAESEKETRTAILDILTLGGEGDLPLRQTLSFREFCSVLGQCLPLSTSVVEAKVTEVSSLSSSCCAASSKPSFFLRSHSAHIRSVVADSAAGDSLSNKGVTTTQRLYSRPMSAPVGNPTGKYDRGDVLNVRTRSPEPTSVSTVLPALLREQEALKMQNEPKRATYLSNMDALRERQRRLDCVLTIIARERRL